MYLFVFLIILILYIFAGYPLLLLILAKNKGDKKSPPVGSYQYSITAVIIACNEESVIEEKIKNILSLDYPPEKLNLIIVDDASTDNTVDVIKGINSKRIKLLTTKQRSGKAAGLNYAMENVNSHLVFMLDARQSINLTASKDLSSWFEVDDKVGAVSGELQFKKENSNNTSEGMDGYWRYEKMIRKSESVISSVPGVTGAIYMLRASLYQKIPEDTILDDVLIPMNMAAKGYWIGFDERAVALDIPSHDINKEKLRKTRTIKGNYQLWLRNISFSIPLKHPIWWQYLSHKVLRLLAPYAALLTLILSLLIGYQENIYGYIYACLFTAGLLMYPISLRASWMLDNSLMRLWISFIALNWFNMLGFFHYVFDKKQQAWKK
jgi:cellulose synthase/poly-beta-1,6-N-acetylglucosamine synthase-like glycosyltransferase